MKIEKVTVLALVTSLVLLFLIIEPSRDPVSLAKHIVAGAGEIVIIGISAAIGLEMAKKFGFGSSLGKALLFSSLGIISWAIGNAAWLFYTSIESISIPYPSLADVGYLGFIPLSTLGLCLFLISVKPKFSLIDGIKVIIFPLIVFFVAYRLFIADLIAQNVSPLTKILNVTYPVGSTIVLSLALAIWSFIGGKLKVPLGVVSAGFALTAIADFSFSWTTANGTYFDGGWVTMTYILSFCVIGLGMSLTKDAYS